MPLRVLFFGTPGFAVPSLFAIVRSSHTLAGVVTQPDRPRGRGHQVRYEAVKRAALDHQLPIWQPAALKDPALLSALAALRPDVAVVAAYGRLLPRELLDLPPLGCLNVHASLLPRWRGAAPVHRAILAGDAVTGVTIMRVVPALDAGPTLAHASTPIGPNETSVDLESRLATMGAGAIIAVLDALEGGPVPEVPQDEAGVTYAPKLERADGRLEWTLPAADVHNRIRGLHPWPLAAASLGGRRLLLRRSIIEHTSATGLDAGTVVRAGGDGIVVATRPGAVRLLELQLEGRRAMSARDFLNGTRVVAGDRFEAMRQ